MKGKLLSVLLAVLLLTIAFSGCFEENKKSKTIYVDISGGKDFTIIQDAINDANPGDTIYVYSGTYNENIVINKTITLIGEDKNTTIINGSGWGDILYISADYVNISGFSIQNAGDYLYGIESFDGIGIHSNYNSIKNNIITNNTDAGISLQNSTNNIVNNNIISFNEENGIVLMFSSNNNTISDNIIMNNDQGGIEIDTGRNNIILDNTIMNNIQSGIELWSDYHIISGNNISYNGKGITLTDANNNTIYENTIKYNPTGISIWAISFLSISKDNTIYHNNILYGYPVAEDNGNNTWYSETLKEGNYWSTNYRGVDANGDGIGDTPYNIEGGDNIDPYPLMNPVDI